MYSISPIFALYNDNGFYAPILKYNSPSNIFLSYISLLFPEKISYLPNDFTVNLIYKIVGHKRLSVLGLTNIAYFFTVNKDIPKTCKRCWRKCYLINHKSPSFYFLFVGDVAGYLIFLATCHVRCASFWLIVG